MKTTRHALIAFAVALLSAPLNSLRATDAANDFAPLEIGAMIQPLAESGVFKVEGYFCWCPHLLKDEGKYYLVYSRWPMNSQKVAG